MSVIVLNENDLKLATEEAWRQMERKQQYNRTSDHGGASKRSLEERMLNTKNGLLGEIAVSKYLNKPWTPGGVSITRGDVDHKIEVRATNHPGGHLLIYDTDTDSSWFVLAIGSFPEFRLAGAILCRKAKSIGRWRETADPPCWWVPQSLLIPPERWIKAQPHKPFIHYCHCGKWGAFGHNVRLLKGQEGQWWCFEHRPVVGNPAQPTK